MLSVYLHIVLAHYMKTRGTYTLARRLTYIFLKISSNILKPATWKKL